MRSAYRWLVKRLKTFNYLIAYLEGAYLHFNDIIWGVAVTTVLVGVPFLVWGLVSQFREIRPWVNWTAILVASVISGYYVWRADHIRLVPGIKAVDTKHAGTETFHQWEGAGYRTFSQVILKCVSEAPVYECTGRLQRACRFNSGQWEDIDIDSGLVLQWSNEDQRSIEQHPKSEKPLNVFYIQHSDKRIMLCVNPDADIPAAKLDRLFTRIGPIQCFRFYIQVTCSTRIEGKYIAIAPCEFCLEIFFENSPYEPRLEILKA